MESAEISHVDPVSLVVLLSKLEEFVKGNRVHVEAHGLKVESNYLVTRWHLLSGEGVDQIPDCFMVVGSWMDRDTASIAD